MTRTGGGQMSIEIANESGVDVDEACWRAWPGTSWTGCGAPAGRAVGAARGRARHDRVARAMDGRRGSHRRAGVPHGRVAAAAAGTHGDHSQPDPDATEALLGDVVICPQVAAGRRRRRSTTSRTRSTCCARTASFTCSAMTTPIRRSTLRCSGCRTGCWPPGGPSRGRACSARPRTGQVTADGLAAGRCRSADAGGGWCTSAEAALLRGSGRRERARPAGRRIGRAAAGGAGGVPRYLSVVATGPGRRGDLLSGARHGACWCTGGESAGGPSSSPPSP